MKAFWWSLIGFCVLMCSCKTQKSAHLINEASKESIQTELSMFESLTDTLRLHKIGIDKSKLKIIETIKITEYDKESGKPIKETHAEREIAQDSYKVVAETEEREVTEENDILLKNESDFSKIVDSEVKEESIGGQSMFGKWFGIGLALIISFLFLYLLKKLRVN
jgi:hypothetical protein